MSMRRWAGCAAAVVAVAVLGSCRSSRGAQDDTAPPEPDRVSYKEFLSNNLSRLNRLTVGMTRDEVLATMGNLETSTRDSSIPNPYRTESFAVGGSQYEVLHYLTRKHPPFTPIKPSQATPVVLRDGVLVGWGQSALDAATSGRAP